MLRPEQMSRVSVTGTKRVMVEVVEALHELNLVHLESYDGSWEGFKQGDPAERADEVSEQLVTVRSIESILDIDEADAGPARSVAEADIEAELESIRTEVNELDDRRSDLRDDLRAIQERISTVEPFVDLGIDLDLLTGYESVEVRAGHGLESNVRSVLTELEEPFELHIGDDVLAVFAAVDAETLDEALVGTGFTAIEIPDGEGDPAGYIEELEHDQERIRSKLTTVENEIEELKLDAAQFLLAAEERLSIEVQKHEAPLDFATTENAFIAEGWIPTEEYDALEEALREAAGEHVEVEELERADYDPPAHESHHEASEVAADGGTTMGGHAPPVIQDNPGPVKPFQLMVETINRPQYWSLDPTVILFLTFPLFFGFMIGDVGYGILYLAIGYWLWTSFASDAIKSLGGIAMWAGGFTMLFGVLYGEIFGLHTVSDILWNGHPPMHKGLQPADVEFAQTWLVVVLLAGLAHVTIGYVLDFARNLHHGVSDAVLESGSWIMLMLGVWIWIFSRQGFDSKPEFLFTVFNSPGASLPTGATVAEAQVAYALGFGGLSPPVGIGGLVLAGIGFVLLLRAEGGIGLLESLNVLVNILSYARIPAVLLAKAGMAFVTNLLFFGVYAEGEPAEYHFMINHGPEYVLEHHHEAEILFGGLLHSGIAGVIGGILVLVIGHLIVLGLGITSAGLQALRLEYVEFFSKFYYEGEAGEPYDPFGYDRTFTAQD